MKKAVRFSVSINPELLKSFDEVIVEKGYRTRSKAIRDLIRSFIVEREWERAEGEVMGSLTILYDHEVKGIVERLIDIQHKWFRNVISTMHIHIDEHNCMEILALRGLPNEIIEISNELISCKGVKHGRLVMSSTGRGIT
ncbi:nickel-responsive transcriptional regulator NikR [Candidatus Bathyarchaeota archaeon]|nr:MAG: nickel-responsive transcriptional regulator NikR [Candidatus Bathyarchaeota archaeon]